MIYSAIEQVIGDTPLLKIDTAHYDLVNTDIYFKLEYLNPFGSIKDRSVLGMISEESWREIAKKEQSIIESSSGNTAKTLQVLANKYGVSFTSVTNRIKIPEVEQLLKYLGTEIVSLPGRSECSDPNDAEDAIGTIKRMMQAHPERYSHTSQYTNRDNTRAHTITTAEELYRDLEDIDVIVTGVGTGGSSGGIIEYAKANGKMTKHIGVVAEPTDFLPGIRTRNELFETELFHREDFSDLYEVSSIHALSALRQLIRSDGILAGPTTGAGFAAALRYARNNDILRADGKRQVIVCIACDRLETYLSYIAKRQPEYFESQSKTDVYSLELTPAQKRVLSKDASQKTAQWIADAQPLIIDTRGVKPFTAFHIHHSICYPEEVLREVLHSETPFTKSRPLLFVCPTGDRSQLLAGIASRRGYDAYSLEGGLLAWRTAGLTFERPQGNG